MSQAPSLIADAARILAARRKGSEHGPRLPEACRPIDVDSALAMQAAVTEQLGESIGGWKCGTPIEHGVIIAPIHAGTVRSGSPCTVVTTDGQIRVEPELAFILGHDLPARDEPYSPHDVDAAIVRTHLALELIGSRYSNPAEAGFLENLADGLLNQGLFIGPQVDREKAYAACTMAIHVCHETGEERILDGRHPNADPRAPLYWLAEFLRSKGNGLKAGQAVITGSYAGSVDVPAGKDITIRYGELGVLTVRFV